MRGLKIEHREYEPESETYEGWSIMLHKRVKKRNVYVSVYGDYTKNTVLKVYHRIIPFYLFIKDDMILSRIAQKISYKIK